MKIKDLTDWMVMPHTADPMGLIHRAGTGPNNRYDFKNKGNNRMNEQEPEIKYKPTIDTDEEWKEAGYIDPQTKQPRYPQLAKLGPAGFAALVNRGRNEKVTRPENIKNTTATSVQQAKREFPNLRPSARANFKSQIQQGAVERPIVVRFGPGDTNDVLIGGNTRFTGLMAMGIQPEVKFIDISNQQEALESKFNEYFPGPRTLGEPGYGPAHPLHPSNAKSLSDRFKEKFKSLFNKKKEEPKREWTEFEMACMEGGHPLPEDAAGVGIITKQNTTKDVKPGDEYKNVKKLQLEYKQFLENFADKKVKGKSRPGRVKRAGASCKGSVSSLRSKAKKYGGERAKMYHWCANMKSGRKKS
jgi:hypothetical protein